MLATTLGSTSDAKLLIACGQQVCDFIKMYQYLLEQKKYGVQAFYLL